jgi:hypothetical protein
MGQKGLDAQPDPQAGHDPTGQPIVHRRVFDAGEIGDLLLAATSPWILGVSFPQKLARVHYPAMRKILTLLVLPPLIVAVFIYHAEMMTRLFRFQQVQVRYLALRDTD